MSDISPEQREDIAKLFAESMTDVTVENLAEAVLGSPDAVAALHEEGQDPKDFIQLVVERLHEAGKLEAALAIVAEDFSRDWRLLRVLEHVMDGGRRTDFDALHAIVHAPDEPFLDDNFTMEVYPRVRSKMCAIGLGSAGNMNKIMGSGFLVGPDLVMTNFHVIVDYLEENGEVGGEMTYRPKQGVGGEHIFCFFDYTAAPKPDVPPKSYRGVVVKAVAKDWLVWARAALPGDGVRPRRTAAEVGRKLDYAIIRLERPMGRSFSRRSGGAPRGWIELNRNAEGGAFRPRIILMQHPDGRPLLHDVGEFDSFDSSETRVRYTLNAARGSSGGAAINKNGQLYALHNARVLYESRPLNQGIRITKILDDLARAPTPWVPQPPPNPTDPSYWSLTDTIDPPMPIIGREVFRTLVQQMMKLDSPSRLLSVIGHPGSGRNFSVRLLRRIVGNNVPIIEFSPGDLASLSPDKFLLAIKRQLGLSGSPKKLGESASTPEHWRNVELPEWLAKAVIAGKQQHPSRYPCWIVLNTVGKKDKVGDPDKPLDWAEGLFELVGALTGGPDLGQPDTNIADLRWLMLGEKESLFPPTSWKREKEDLDSISNEAHAGEFAACLDLAWRALGREGSNAPIMMEAVVAPLILDKPKSGLRSTLGGLVISALQYRNGP